MKKFTIALLGVIFVVLLSGSVESVSADHLLPGEGVFKNENDVNIASSIDSKYQIHLHMIVRNAQNQLVGVSQAVWGYYIPHQITDQIFDEMSGKKEIVTVDDIKYEKVQYILKDRHYKVPYKLMFFIPAVIEVSQGLETVIVDAFIFQAFVPLVYLEDDDVVDTQWTIFRKLN